MKKQIVMFILPEGNGLRIMIKDSKENTLQRVSTQKGSVVFCVGTKGKGMVKLRTQKLRTIVQSATNLFVKIALRTITPRAILENRLL